MHVDGAAAPRMASSSPRAIIFWPGYTGASRHSSIAMLAKSRDSPTRSRHPPTRGPLFFSTRRPINVHGQGFPVHSSLRLTALRFRSLCPCPLSHSWRAKFYCSCICIKFDVLFLSRLDRRGTVREPETVLPDISQSVLLKSWDI